MRKSKYDFQFRETINLPEELDYEHLRICPHCGKPIPQNATMCLYCGERVYSNTHKKWIIFTAIFIIAIFLLFILF